MDAPSPGVCDGGASLCLCPPSHKWSYFLSFPYCKGCFPGGSGSNEFPCNEGDPGSIPVSGRSPGEGNGYPLQYSCLENSMDRGAWWATVHGAMGLQRDMTEQLAVSRAVSLRSLKSVCVCVCVCVCARAHGGWWCLTSLFILGHSPGRPGEGGLVPEGLPKYRWWVLTSLILSPMEIGS